jgi:hypothetical protein
VKENVKSHVRDSATTPHFQREVKENVNSHVRDSTVTPCFVRDVKENVNSHVRGSTVTPCFQGDERESVNSHVLVATTTTPCFQRDGKENVSSPVRVSKTTRLRNAIKSFSPCKESSAFKKKEGYKVLHFVYSGKKFDLKYFPGTPIELIWKTLFKEMGILQRNVDFESLMNRVSFLDSNGCSVVFSPEHIPDDEMLHVQIDIPVQPVTVHLNDKQYEYCWDSEDKDFAWNNMWNSLYCGYTLLNDCRTIRSGTSILSRSVSIPILISNRCFHKGTGIYEWSVIFSKETNENGAGILSEEEISFPRKCAAFANHPPSVPWFYKTAVRGTNNVYIILDTNNSQITINGKLIKGIPDVVYAGVCFKMSSQVEATVINL